MDDSDLKFIPRVVRDKLDRVAIKLHLAEWQAFSLKERRLLCEFPCANAEEIAALQARLEALVVERCGYVPQKMQANVKRKTETD